MVKALSSIGPRANRLFANRVKGFANRALGWPAWPTLELASAIALVLAILTGPFGTHAIAPMQRGAFWLALLGFNALCWRFLINRMVKRPADWPRAALLGTLLFSLPLPLEIRLVLRLVGIEGNGGPVWTTWAEAAVITALIYFAARIWGRPRLTPPADSPAADALLERWAILPERLVAVLAEDHYCRLVMADGSERLVHGRFGETVAALAALPGLQVHRGAWVADRAVRGALREGRGWRLQLEDGRQIRVSASRRGEVRRRGLLQRTQS